MNYYSSLVKTIDQLKAQGKLVKLTQLLTEDTQLLNDTIVEYVQLLGNTNRMHDLHEYTCKELENDWGRG